MCERRDTDVTLAELADVVLRIARILEPHAPDGPDIVPLTGTEATVLRWIHHHPGTSPSATADATGLKRSNLSAALRGLENKKMIERLPPSEGTRLIRLALTPTALDNIARLHQHWARRVRDALGNDTTGLPEAQTLLERLDTGLRETPPSPPTRQSDPRHGKLDQTTSSAVQRSARLGDNHQHQGAAAPPWP